MHLIALLWLGIHLSGVEVAESALQLVELFFAFFNPFFFQVLFQIVEIQLPPPAFVEVRCASIKAALESQAAEMHLLSQLNGLMMAFSEDMANFIWQPSSEIWGDPFS
jgi:hypothetical protein